MSNQQKTEIPTGAGKKPALRVAFDGRLKLEFHGSKVSSDAGLLADRELGVFVRLAQISEFGGLMANETRLRVTNE